jgi:hypothetical protein
MTRPVVERVIVGGWRTATAQLEGTRAPKTGQTGQTGQRVDSAWEFGAFSGQTSPSHNPKLARGPVLGRTPGMADIASPIAPAQRTPQP